MPVEILESKPNELMIYETFRPSKGNNAAPGHFLFSSQGASLWENDVIEFLGHYLYEFAAGASVLAGHGGVAKANGELP